ncbi:Hypothetical predicted protein [Marmota monax]|uniref:Uncharacterized protein n=1 Tax=Marmota monax TaxID=9995 RepID=A0A5E4C8Q1_MARMO|nr:hypothetical protein GHT09_001872 [Marmota monax]VTJ77361.1 Hypothetical predicted protein [Marmota monax]
MPKEEGGTGRSEAGGRGPLRLRLGRQRHRQSQDTEQQREGLELEAETRASTGQIPVPSLHGTDSADTVGPADLSPVPAGRKADLPLVA